MPHPPIRSCCSLGAILETISDLLIVPSRLGLLSFYTFGGLIYLPLVIVVIAILLHLIGGRRASMLFPHDACCP
jgi:hypothetical protein